MTFASYSIDYRMLKRAAFSPSNPGAPRRALSQVRPQATHEPEAYPLGYVEDSRETRTQLMACFSIRLKEPLTTEEKGPGHPSMGHAQSYIPLTLIDEILLVQ